MKKRCLFLLCLLVFFSSTGWAAELPAEKYVWNDLDTRTYAFISLDDPTFQYSPAYLFNGCKVLVVEENEALGVSKIDVMGNTRWVQSKYLVDTLQESQVPYFLERKTLIDTDVYAVRSELADPAPEYTVTGSIPRGETVQILANLGALWVRYEENDMYILDRRLEDGERTVWFASLDLEEETHPSLLSKEACLQLAYRHLSEQYGLSDEKIRQLHIYSHYTNYISKHNEYVFRFSIMPDDDKTFYQINVQPETGLVVQCHHFQDVANEAEVVPVQNTENQLGEDPGNG